LHIMAATHIRSVPSLSSAAVVARRKHALQPALAIASNAPAPVMACRAICLRELSAVSGSLLTPARLNRS
jgi:hypothetical protein